LTAELNFIALTFQASTWGKGLTSCISLRGHSSDKVMICWRFFSLLVLIFFWIIITTFIQYSYVRHLSRCFSCYFCFIDEETESHRRQITHLILKLLPHLHSDLN
jgi:hypothetical protein